MVVELTSSTLGVEICALALFCQILVKMENIEKLNTCLFNYFHNLGTSDIFVVLKVLTPMILKSNED